MPARAFNGERRFVLVVMLISMIAGICFHSAPAFGAFNNSSSRNATFTAVTLQPPVKLNEVPNGSRNDCKVTLSWVIPQPGIPNNWVIQRYIGTNESGGYIMLPGTATSYVDDAVNTSTSYSWKIVALVGTSWISPITTSNVESLTSSCV